MDNIKPPLGIMPRAIWIKTRLDSIEDAINRIFKEVYTYPIPMEWIEEYNELIGELNKLDAKNKGLEVGNAD